MRATPLAEPLLHEGVLDRARHSSAVLVVLFICLGTALLTSRLLRNGDRSAKALSAHGRAFTLASEADPHIPVVDISSHGVSRKRKRLPVTLLCGFLGAGKTTLLSHILKRKHAEGTLFRCAVIVNDMAELNIDKSLIDRSALVQSDEVIAMQNGCVCCTLKNELVEQIIGLAKKDCFDYMIIEASGVSEPAQVARYFAECDDNHDHEAAHGKDSLGEFARLDTCVTVVDSVDFFNNLENIQLGENSTKLYPQLLMEQVEYSDVVILNKLDLVSQSQLANISERVALLNPHAKILTARNSKIDVMDVVDTGLYNESNFKLAFDDGTAEEAMPECCVKKTSAGEPPCCKRGRTLDSGKSQVLLGSQKLAKTRHELRFGITSFLYRARRPFHPRRFLEGFVEKYFVHVEPNMEEDESEVEGSESEMEDGNASAGQNDTGSEEDEEDEDDAKAREQEEANEKQSRRIQDLGELFRSKGFVWITHTHDVRLAYQQAGNVVTMDQTGRWSVVSRSAYLGPESKKAALRKDWVDPWGDRRQELVFIGKDLKHKTIQEKLDDCLLTDTEMAMGIDGWKATMGDIILESNLGDDEEPHGANATDH